MEKGKNVYLTAEEKRCLLEIVKSARMLAEETQRADDIPPYIFQQLIKKLEK